VGRHLERDDEQLVEVGASIPGSRKPHVLQKIVRINVGPCPPQAAQLLQTGQFKRATVSLDVSGNHSIITSGHFKVVRIEEGE